MKKTLTAIALTSCAIGCNHETGSQSANSPNSEVNESSDGSAAIDQWDSDNDDALSQSEFGDAVNDKDYFSSWDADGNGELTDLEYQTGLFNAWDTDGDQIVDTYEYRDASSAWFPQSQTTFVDWDADGNSELTISEFQNGINTYGYYSSWDADGNGELVDMEYQTGLFNAWDTNGDQVVDAYEYRW